MKKIVVFLGVVAVVAFFSACKQNRLSEYHIVVAEDADSLTLKAALEVQYYIEQSSGDRLPIDHAPSGANDILVGTQVAQLAELDSLPEDAFIIRHDQQQLVLAGKDGKSTLYAAYSFAEDVLGCRMLAPGEEYIPKNTNLSLPAMDSTYIPAFPYRRVLCPGLYDHKYSQWHKLENLEEWGMFVHTFSQLIPAAKYYDAHPDYFSLVNGTRVGNSQLCLSHPEVIALLKANLAKEMMKQPNKKYWSVSQNDCFQYCECAGCKALYEKYGTVSGAYIHMANQIAEAFPDKVISTLAYQFTRSAPSNIKLLPNVNVMLCSIECNRSIPLSKDASSKQFVQDVKDWAALTDNIFLWDYVVQFKNLQCPFPVFHTLQPNMQFFKQNGVAMMFEQASGRIWSDMIELKQYLLAKMIWNPELDQDKLIDEFMHLYYGNAAPYVTEYFETVHAEMIKDQKKQNLDIYGFPMSYVNSFLQPELIKKYKALMDQAEEVVASDSVYLKRIQRQRLAVDFACLDIALEGDFDNLSFFKTENGVRTVDSSMIAYLYRYKTLANKYTTTINERMRHSDDYVDYALTRLNRMAKSNMLKTAGIKLLSRPSDRYPVGKELALKDGKLGPMHFREDWLGFFGEDFIVEIDLKEVKPVSEISMNFLKDVDSWIFLPEEVLIELSSDGKSYQALEPIVYIDENPRHYLVLSIPYQVSLDREKVRYIRISTKSMKRCPIWHRGYGNPSWLFVDEVIVH